MNSPNVANKIIEQLSSWKVKTIFGFVGDNIFHLMDALAQQNGIKFYQVRHEESAALMASAHAKLTGELGVCIADGGPGTVHLLNGLADAHTDKVPVLAITGQVKLKDVGTNAKQYLNQQLLISSLAAYSDMLVDPNSTIKIMEKAYRKAITGKSVSHITIPKDIFAAPCTKETAPLAPYLKEHPVSSDKVISDAIEAINRAKNPTIIVGEGGRPYNYEVTQLSLKLGAGIITSLAGTGVVDKGHPLYIGGLGHAGSPASTKILNQSDLCLIIGANWWPKNYVPQGIDTVKIDKNPSNLNVGPKYTYGIAGDCGEILSAIIQGVDPKNNKKWQDMIKGEINSWLGVLEKEVNENTFPVHPAAVIKSLEKNLPTDALICLDTGDSTAWFGRVFRPANQRAIISGKWRTMGFALPAAIAAKIHSPNSPVVAIAGDGGFTMTFAEFITAIKYELPIVVVVLNNGCLAMEKNRMLMENLQPLGTDLLNPDFAGFANICGGVGIKVDNVEQLDKALTEGLKSQKPVVIDVNTSAIEVPGASMPS
ncbi:MAG: thiamine pyrophosphate-binding protein [Clostridia bacterium]|nr:thiamine pyrophosphate-binding protein [Clostridia bacterium]